MHENSAMLLSVCRARRGLPVGVTHRVFSRVNGGRAIVGNTPRAKFHSSVRLLSTEFTEVGEANLSDLSPR